MIESAQHTTQPSWQMDVVKPPSEHSKLTRDVVKGKSQTTPGIKAVVEAILNEPDPNTRRQLAEHVLLVQLLPEKERLEDEIEFCWTTIRDRLINKDDRAARQEFLNRFADVEKAVDHTHDDVAPN